MFLVIFGCSTLLNTYDKHNDAVKYSEIDFVINLTTLFMRNFILALSK